MIKINNKDTGKMSANCSSAHVNKYEQTLHFVSMFLLPFSISKYPLYYARVPSRNHNATNPTSALDSYQSCFRKLDILFSGKQQGIVRTEQKCILFFSTIFAWLQPKYFLNNTNDHFRFFQQLNLFGNNRELPEK